MTNTPKIYPTFGALDSDCVADGRPLDAHVLQTLAGSSNRLITRSAPLASLVWNAAPPAVVELPGTNIAYAMPFWSQVTPRIPIIKMPLIKEATLLYTLGASDDAEIGLQIATDQAPFDPTLPIATSMTVAEIIGSATSPYGDVKDRKNFIPLREGAVNESVAFYLRGGYGDLADTGTYGSPNSGTIESISGNNPLYGSSIKVSGATWNSKADGDPTSDRLDGGGHVFIFKNGLGDTILEPRLIRFVQREDELTVFPGVPEDFRGEVLRGADFEIRKLPVVRFHGLMLYSMEL